MPTEWDSDQYDQVYASGGADRIYDLPYRHSGYYPLFKTVASALRAHGARSVFEVGCGTGGFAHLWLDQHAHASYRGFDFSPVAVDRARKRLGRDDLFYIADARNPDSYVGEYDALACTEVLEHIDDDLGVMDNWRNGTYCVCSVPNFAAENHVRVFSSADEIRERYGSKIDITNIRQVKKPYLFDLSWPSYLRELRWNRYRPQRIARILGLAGFSTGGGWYLFSGYRR